MTGFCFALFRRASVRTSRNRFRSRSRKEKQPLSLLAVVEASVAAAEMEPHHESGARD